MLNGKLTEDFCSSIKFIKDSTKKQDYSDGNWLILRLTVKNKSWFVKYNYLGKHRTMSIGSYTKISLNEARKECQQIQIDAACGLDPFEMRIKRFKSDIIYFDI